MTKILFSFYSRFLLHTVSLFFANINYYFFLFFSYLSSSTKNVLEISSFNSRGGISSFWDTINIEEILLIAISKIIYFGWNICNHFPVADILTTTIIHHKLGSQYFQIVLSLNSYIHSILDRYIKIRFLFLKIFLFSSAFLFNHLSNSVVLPINKD